MLVGKGKIRLDDAPGPYGVPVRPYAGTGITIRQLLSMTAGIQHGWLYDYGSDVDRKELLHRYAISAFPPGQHFIYSNFSFGILAEVVEQAGQRPFREFMRDELLNRLHMSSSGFSFAGHDVGVGYQAGKAVPAHTFEPEAGGGFYTSAHDLALFGLFQFAADVFSSGLLANLESTRKEVEAAETPRPFHAGESQRGSWIGTVDTPKGQLPVRLQIIADDQVQMGIDGGVMVPVNGLALTQNFLSGEAATSVSLPETRNQPSKLALQLLWVDGNRLIGTARAESTGDLPRFGLPMYISVSKEK